MENNNVSRGTHSAEGEISASYAANINHKATQPLARIQGWKMYCFSQ